MDERFFTAGLLPPRLRRASGVSWNGKKDRMLRLAAGATRALLPLLPSSIRVVPRAGAAELRAKRPFIEPAAETMR